MRHGVWLRLPQKPRPRTLTGNARGLPSLRGRGLQEVSQRSSSASGIVIGSQSTTERTVDLIIRGATT
jgi:hypothetical protein